MKILIVDDEVGVARLLAESIRLQGHEAIVAGNGEEGLALIEQKHPDAVFLDVVMPEVSGIEVLRRIRERFHALPVIIITGNASSQQIDEARRLGITDCIEKPFGLKGLDHAIESVGRRKP